MKMKSNKLIKPSFSREEFLEAIIHHNICVAQEVYIGDDLDREVEEDYLSVQDLLHSLFVKSITLTDWNDFLIEEWVEYIVLSFIKEVDGNRLRNRLLGGGSVSLN